MKFILTLVLLFTSILYADIQPEKIPYKITPQDTLHLFVFKPDTANTSKSAIVFFFGGGWVNGNPSQFFEHGKYLASRGMVAFCAEYRIFSKHGTTPFECVEDGKSAVRWIREHADEFGIDPEKIVAAGGSAGGHVAACTSIIEGYDNEWSDWTRYPVKEYTNLRPGEYELKVRAGAQGVILAENVLVRFRKLQPFYLHGMAILVYGVVALLLAYFIYRP